MADDQKMKSDWPSNVRPSITAHLKFRHCRAIIQVRLLKTNHRRLQTCLLSESLKQDKTKRKRRATVKHVHRKALETFQTRTNQRLTSRTLASLFAHIAHSSARGRRCSFHSKLGNKENKHFIYLYMA